MTRFLSIMGMMAILCLASGSDDNSWREKYESRFGSIGVETRPAKYPFFDGNNASSTKAIVDEWYKADVDTACSCKILDKKPITWTNGLVTTDTTEIKLDYETLYAHRVVLETLANITHGDDRSSESDYIFSMFNVKITEDLDASSLSQGMGFSKTLVNDKNLINGQSASNKGTLPKAIEFMKRSSKNGIVQGFTVTDKYFCDGFAYIVNPVILAAQHHDGTVFGLVSTDIWT
jgi:hypothetical protein